MTISDCCWFYIFLSLLLFSIFSFTVSTQCCRSFRLRYISHVSTIHYLLTFSYTLFWLSIILEVYLRSCCLKYVHTRRQYSSYVREIRINVCASESECVCPCVFCLCNKALLSFALFDITPWHKNCLSTDPKTIPCFIKNNNLVT